MLIGSECVKHFGIGNNEEIDNQTEHNRKIRYLNQLDEEFPGIEKIIDFWNEFIDENDYIIANDYTESYIEIGSKIKKLYEKYLKQNTTQKSRLDIVQSLERLFKEGELERKVIQSIVDSYKEDLFAPRKEYLKRVDEETKMDILSRFEGGSKVNRLIGWRINNIMLTKHVISLISGDIKKNRFKPQRIIEFKGRTGVILNYEELNYIDFFCYHKDIVQIFCEEVFDDKDSFQLVDIDKFDDLIKTVKIIDYDMMASAVRMILDQRSNRYEIYENEFTDYGFNEVFIRDKVGNTFYQLDLNGFVENFSSILFKDNKSDANKINAFIPNKGKIIKKEDIDYLASRRA